MRSCHIRDDISSQDHEGPCLLHLGHCDTDVIYIVRVNMQTTHMTERIVDIYHPADMSGKTGTDEIPMKTSKEVAACVGFPSPAQNYMKKTLDLNAYVIRHPAATFFVRVRGDSMTGVGIQSEDILVVDRALSPVDNCVVVAVVDGEFVVRRLRIRKSSPRLIPVIGNERAIEVTESTAFEIWGVVTHVIHPLL